MKMKNCIFLVFVLASAACQTPLQRGPISTQISKEWAELRVLKQRRVELSAISIHFQKKKNQIQLDQIKAGQKSIDKRIREIESTLSSLEANSSLTSEHRSGNW